jgi:DNA-binding NtrC family response regulator
MTPNQILLVDDDKDYLLTFAQDLDKRLEKVGFEAVTFETGASALTYLHRNHSRVALIIVDIILRIPARSEKLLQQVKKEFAGVKRIALTGKAHRTIVGRYGTRGLIHGYIDKEQSPTDMVEEIRRVLKLSCSEEAHKGILAALHTWVAEDPRAKNHTIQFMDGSEMTLAQIASEIERGTPFGKSQESVIYRMACDMFSTRSARSRTQS